jgi:hypothetical protein
VEKDMVSTANRLCFAPAHGDIAAKFVATGKVVAGFAIRRYPTGVLAFLGEE